jgi:hypothetical protein
MAGRPVYFLIFLILGSRLEIRNLAGYTSPNNEMVGFEEQNCQI